MILLAPLLLLGLLTLPALWWFIRATPPAPRTQRFPSLLILQRLRPERQDAARSPLWLLVLRVCAAACIILGLARPVLPGHPLPNTIPTSS
ncbi:BatA domain-containing protein [Neokomagataea tanensis]|uniref:BatA domain-containing protein n=1 Tax=Neokomagataea tanensis TaxID=661191 RepID=UPI001F0D3FCB|nr:BatA domain-containing protein [Neokomagataea tanensis]